VEVTTFEGVSDIETVYAESFTVSLSVNPTGGGTTNGSGPYFAGVPVIIEATANTDYTFVNWTDDDNGNIIVSPNASYSFPMPAANVNYTAHFTPDIVIEPGDIHANLSKKDVVIEDSWNLHVWFNITNPTSQTFEARLRMRTYQDSTTTTRDFAFVDIDITPGKAKYPIIGDYWLMEDVGLGSAPKDVEVTIWIEDRFGNPVTEASRFAN